MCRRKRLRQLLLTLSISVEDSKNVAVDINTREFFFHRTVSSRKCRENAKRLLLELLPEIGLVVHNTTLRGRCAEVCKMCYTLPPKTIQAMGKPSRRSNDSQHRVVLLLVSLDFWVLFHLFAQGFKGLASAYPASIFLGAETE
ncbi:hypothetical protein M501DRAFT_214529 [Patellaria atrata CBS 101060]|uniref:Uncharacterized protein n=1 Tax=Patellaria atrata CBS 101060 TaxID=1346257 RepID=A0A9P4S6F8_9PEZI|nr:hypothetical protein M501DRAFT_214529 [Patellaria atrata CBS 101060]